MEKNEFKQVLKNNVSELIALQEQCQNTDVKCAQSILNTILWMKEINEDIEGEIIPSSYANILINSFDFLSPMMNGQRKNVKTGDMMNSESMNIFANCVPFCVLIK